MKIGRWLNDAEFYFLVEKGDQFTHPLRSFVPFCFHHSSALKKKKPGRRLITLRHTLLAESLRTFLYGLAATFLAGYAAM